MQGVGEGQMDEAIAAQDQINVRQITFCDIQNLKLAVWSTIQLPIAVDDSRDNIRANILL